MIMLTSKIWSYIKRNAATQLKNKNENWYSYILTAKKLIIQWSHRTYKKKRKNISMIITKEITCFRMYSVNFMAIKIPNHNMCSQILRNDIQQVILQNIILFPTNKKELTFTLYFARQIVSDIQTIKSISRKVIQQKTKEKTK